MPGSEKTLALLLDSVAAGAGYAWEWKDDRVVFYRYWDRSWPGAEVVEVEAPKGPFDGVMAWISRVLGRSGEGGREWQRCRAGAAG